MALLQHKDLGRESLIAEMRLIEHERRGAILHGTAERVPDSFGFVV